MAESRSEFVEKQQPASGLVGSSKVGPEAGPHETTGLTSDSPPPYAEVVPTAPARTHTADKAAAFEHATSHPEPVAESVVNRQEIVEAFSRISPHKIVAERDIAVVKELVETMLRYQEEQGVPSTALQKQVTLAKVLQSYQLGSLQSLLNTYTPHLQLPSAGVGDEQSVVRVTEQPRTPQPGPVIRVTEQPGTPQPEPVIGVVLQQQPGICQPGVGVIGQPAINRPDPKRVTIGTWPSFNSFPRYDAYGRPIPTITNHSQQITYAYADQIPKLITVMAVLMVICCVVGSPLSLCCTIPGLYWIRKVAYIVQCMVSTTVNFSSKIIVY